MGLLGRLSNLFSPSVDPDDGDDTDYRCVQCGAGFSRNHHTCPDCGGQFVAPIEDN